VPAPGPGSGRTVLRLGAVAAATHLLAGCGLFEPPRRDAVLVGDSITDQTRDTFDDELGDQWRLRVEAVPGLRIAEMQGALEAAVAEGPDAVVVNLGTNDVLAEGPLAEGAVADLTAALDVAAEVPCGYAVTINEHMFQYEDDLADQARTLNEALVRLADERGMGVVDWSAEVGRQLEAGEPGGSVTHDTVHPTEPFGEQLLATLYADALEGCDG
jgi:lysophospholipase L1-like esterase